MLFNNKHKYNFFWYKIPASLCKPIYSCAQALYTKIQKKNQIFSQQFGHSANVVVVLHHHHHTYTLAALTTTTTASLCSTCALLPGLARPLSGSYKYFSPRFETSLSDSVTDESEICVFIPSKRLE